ncbi:hypothetical protein WJX77_011835 [Trebouxia sp. C0004]
MDQAASTNFKIAQGNFEKHGYKLSKVVLWEPAGLWICGNELETFNPFNVMKEAIGQEKYDNWKVVDK